LRRQKLIQRLMSEATRPDGLAVYGEKQVFEALQKKHG
jgi:peptide subunit release factor 1 (eRF1)